MRVPEGWRSVRLGDVARESRRRNDGSAIDAERLYGVFKDEGMVPMRDRVRGASVERCKVVKPGAFAYNPMRLNIGSIACWTGNEDAIVSPDYVVFECDQRQVNHQYLNYIRKGCDWAKFTEHAGDGGVRVRIYFDHLAEFRLFLPPLSEQRCIVEVLSSIDDAFEATHAVVEQTRKAKTSLLKGLLTRGIGHSRFKQTEIGMIPEAWEVVTVDDVCQRISVGIVVQPTQYYVPEGVKCFRSANVREGRVEDSNWVYISPEANEQLAKSRLESGDVLVVRSGYTGTSCVVAPEFAGANCIDIIFARPHPKKVNPHFLSALINSPVGREQVLRSEGGMAQKHFNVSAMKRMLIPLPDMAEQEAISSRVVELNAQERIAEDEISRLQRLKSALLSDLLTGRKRVTADALSPAL